MPSFNKNLSGRRQIGFDGRYTQEERVGTPGTGARKLRPLDLKMTRATRQSQAVSRDELGKPVKGPRIAFMNQSIGSTSTRLNDAKYLKTRNPATVKSENKAFFILDHNDVKNAIGQDRLLDNSDIDAHFQFTPNSALSHIKKY